MYIETSKLQHHITALKIYTNSTNGINQDFFEKKHNNNNDFLFFINSLQNALWQKSLRIWKIFSCHRAKIIK